MKFLGGSGFLSFLKNGKGGRVAVLLILGALLLCFGLFGNSGVSDTQNTETEEDRLADFCSSVSGVGECRVMLCYVIESSTFGSSKRERVDGVTVLCEGADSVAVRRKLTEMICALYDLGANRVKIEKLESE